MTPEQFRQRFGYLVRIGDSLRLRGYLVNPAEIENVLVQHLGVSGAQVVGVREVGKGDRAVAFITRAGAEFSETAVLAFCREHLAVRTHRRGGVGQRGLEQIAEAE